MQKYSIFLLIISMNLISSSGTSDDIGYDLIGENASKNLSLLKKISNEKIVVENGKAYKKNNIVKEIQNTIHEFEAEYSNTSFIFSATGSTVGILATGAQGIISMFNNTFFPTGAISSLQSILDSSSILTRISVINKKRYDRVNLFVQNLINNGTIANNSSLSKEQITELHTKIIEKIKKEYTYSKMDVVKTILPFANSFASGIISLISLCQNQVKESPLNYNVQILNLISSCITTSTFGYMAINDLIRSRYLDILDEELLALLQEYQQESPNEV